MFGGNSNWRGPVWMPVNFLLYLSLLRLGAYYGDTFKIECPTGSGNQMTLFEVAQQLAERLIGTFVRDGSGAQTGVRWNGEIPNRPALERQRPLLRVLPRRQRCRQSAPATRLDGRAALRGSFRPTDTLPPKCSAGGISSDERSRWRRTRELQTSDN